MTLFQLYEVVQLDRIANGSDSMVKSMTGYGRASTEYNGVQITVEIKSVNHRYFDVSFRMPKSLLEMETKFKKIVQQNVHRGKVDVYIQLEGSAMDSNELRTDWKLLDQYITLLKQAGERYELKDDLSISQLVNLEDVFHVQQGETSLDKVETGIVDALEEAVNSLLLMRSSEGISLNDDIHSKLIEMEKKIELISGMTSDVTKAFETRIRHKLAEFKELEDVDEGRVLTEVALLADKASIDEEITRLRSHLIQFHDILTTEGAIGRKLDFLVQEINRELNTIGSKSTHHMISQYVVDLKSEVEKVREQVQNIE
ncbi:YicC/YloC family endoribonuclease [Guptibacillus algicola]|uniref:YicC/YloC family endoribonuclease n=1 Tax=Guptibacillus algicola TaxID=225844 RepID=UPI001CD57D07|nr:YicC/YloC family endoribonuclease [Alkalihalobacillus algicola]MCA0988016.1 YicC family protein [Alkalihalobacillus algicola]